MCTIVLALPHSPLRCCRIFGPCRIFRSRTSPVRRPPPLRTHTNANTRPHLIKHRFLAAQSRPAQLTTTRRSSMRVRRYSHGLRSASLPASYGRRRGLPAPRHLKSALNLTRSYPSPLTIARWRPSSAKMFPVRHEQSDADETAFH